MAAAGDIVWTSLIPGLSWVENSLPHPETGEPALHVSNAMLIGLIILTLAAIARFRTKTENLTDEDLVPEPGLSVRTLMEVLVSGILGIMRDSMGHVAPRFLYLVGTLAIFILFSNLSGLVPGFSAPTGNLNTTLACALVVFFMTHVYGFKENGIAYLKHFAGPFWWLAWLMIPIEIISHMARPMSLSLRLFGNMTGEHKVGAVFFLLVPLGVPIFTLVLGIFVGTIQTFVFMLLTMVYFSGAIEHGEH